MFVKDLQTGQTLRASIDSAGSQANNESSFPALSGDGRFVAFESTATNRVAGDSNDAADVFVKDLQTGQTTRVSTGTQATKSSSAPALSSHGRFVAFESMASNLVRATATAKRMCS